MTLDNLRPVHADFRLIERTDGAGEGQIAVMGELLRTAWLLPRDTFVTRDIPLLLTLLSLPRGLPEDAPTVGMLDAGKTAELRRRSADIAGQGSERALDEEDG